ncbi:MAG: hypothetical protein WHT65_03925 [Pseudothermotoga sp.]
MKKLLVVLLALVTVAAFGAVSISGSAWAKLQLQYDSETASATPSITSGGSVKLVLSGNTGEKTGFSVTFNGFSVQSAYVWEYLYKTDSLSVKYRLGTFSSWGSSLVTNSGGALALDFAMKSGDLTDNLSVFAYFPADGDPFVDLDVLNTLQFTFVTLTAFAEGLVSAGVSAFPTLGVDLTLDVAKALNISDANLSAYACLEIDPLGSGLDMLPASEFGVEWGIDKFSGSVYLADLESIGAEFETTVLSPVTLGGYVVLPVQVTGFSDIALGAWASWKSELLTHRLSLDFQQPIATIAWKVSVSF